MNVIRAQYPPPLIMGTVSWEPSYCKRGFFWHKNTTTGGRISANPTSMWFHTLFLMILSKLNRTVHPVTALFIPVVNRSYIILVEEAWFCIFWSPFTHESHTIIPNINVGIGTPLPIHYFALFAPKLRHIVLAMTPLLDADTGIKSDNTLQMKISDQQHPPPCYGQQTAV